MEHDLVIISNIGEVEEKYTRSCNQWPAAYYYPVASMGDTACDPIPSVDSDHS